MALNVLPRAQGSQGKWLILAIFCQQSRKRTQRIRSPNRSFEHLLIPFGSLIHPSENHFLQRNSSIQSASTLLSPFLIPSGLIPREYIVLTMFFFFFLLFFFLFLWNHSQDNLIIDKRLSYLRFFMRYLVPGEIILISSSLIYRNHRQKFKLGNTRISWMYNNFYLIPILKEIIIYSQMWIEIKKLFIQINVSRNKNNLTSISKRNTVANKLIANLWFIVSSINRKYNYWNNSINIRELIYIVTKVLTLIKLQHKCSSVSFVLDRQVIVSKFHDTNDEVCIDK